MEQKRDSLENCLNWLSAHSGLSLGNDFYVNLVEESIHKSRVIGGLYPYYMWADTEFKYASSAAIEINAMILISHNPTNFS